MRTDEFTALAESIEAEFMHRYVASAPRSAKSELGIATTRIGGGVALSVRNDVTDYWSKTLGLGFTEPINRGLISRILAFYQQEEAQAAVIQIAPPALPPDWDEICADHDIRADTSWTKLGCRIEDFTPGRTELHVGRVGPNTADAWASVTLRGFGMPEDGFADMLAASVADPDFQAFAVWDGDEMIAAANLFVHGQIGSLNSAATLPEHRNRGAQSGLLAARASEAAHAGCRWLVAEAATPAEDGANPSFDNLRRCGLRPLYERQNWVWRNSELMPSRRR